MNLLGESIYDDDIPEFTSINHNVATISGAKIPPSVA